MTQLNTQIISNLVEIEDKAEIGAFNHVISVEDSLSANFELIKILKRHQGERRWIMLIAPATLPSKALMACCDVDQYGVLVVHHRQMNDSFTTIKNALSQATCEAVVAWDNSLLPEELDQIEVLSRQSKCHFYSFQEQSSAQNAGTISH